MSDLSGLSSIGGTLSALQDTGLREFIETNSGSWTGGETPDLSNYVPYSAYPLVMGTGNDLSAGGNSAGFYQLIIGDKVSSYGNYSQCVILGGNNYTSGYSQIAAIIGRDNRLTGYGFIAGTGNSGRNHANIFGRKNYGSAATIFGYNNTANDACLIVGSNNKVSGYSLVISNKCTADSAVVIGPDSHALYNSIAVGNNNHASGDNYFRFGAQAFGRGLRAYNMMAIGHFNATSAGAAFVIGDGLTSASRSDSFIIFNDGSVSAKGNISANGVELGAGGGAEYSAGSNIDITDNVISGKDWTSEITAATEDMVTTGDLAGYIPRSADNLQFGDNTAQTRCFALGSNVSASDNSFALGQNNSARSYSIALGGTNIANGLSLSIGGNNSAQVNSLAVGNTNSATTASEAVGYYNTANDNSLTVGQYNSAGSYSIAVGYQSRAYWNSIALSNGSANTGSLAIGGNAHTGSIAIGSNANSAANYSQALGYNVSATDNCMAIGKLNATTNAAFVIGNGYTASTGGYYPEYHYSDAFIIDHSGNVSAAGKISANGVELVSFPSSADDVCQAVVSNSANWGDIPTKVVATSADATGSNILYVVTGE